MTQDVTVPSPAAPETPIKKPWYHPWRLFKLIVRIAIYLPLTLLVVLALVLGTPFGAHMAVSLASKLVPGFSAQYQSGTLNRDLALSEVSYAMPGIEVKADAVSLLWQPSCLLAKGVCVNALNLDGVDVAVDTAALPKSDSNKAEEASGPLKLPITLALDSAEINRVNVRLDDMSFAAAQLATGARWQDDGLWVDFLSSDGLLIAIPATAASDEAAKADVSAETAKVEETGKSDATSTSTSTWPLAALPEIQLPMDLHLKAAEIKNSTLNLGERKDHFSLITAAADFEGSQLTLTELLVRHDEANLELKGTVELSKNYPLAIKLKLDTDSPSLMPELGKQQLTLVANGNMDALKAEVDAEGSAELRLALDAALSDPKLPFTLTLDAPRAGWPLSQPEYLATDLKLNASGDLDAQQAKLSTKVTTPFHTPLDLDAVLSNAAQKLNIASLNISGEPGDIQLNGSLDYAKTLSWDANVAFQQLTPSAIMLPENTAASAKADTAKADAPKAAKTDTANTAKAEAPEVSEAVDAANPALAVPQGANDAVTDLAVAAKESGKDKQTAPQHQAATAGTLPSGSLDGKLRVRGSLDNGWQIALSDTDIRGELDGYPVTMGGDVSVDHELHLSAKDFSLAAMGATIDINGDVKKDWALDGIIRAPDLSLLSPELAGQFNATLTVSGAQQDPFVNLEALGVAIKAGGATLESLNIKGMYQPKANHEFALSIKGEQLNIGERKLETITLGGKGDMNSQRLRAQTFGDLRLDTVLHSEFDDKRKQISAVLSRLNIGSEFGDWQLSKDMELGWDLNKNSGSLNDACLVQQSSALCLARPAKLGATGDVALSFRGAPGAIIDRVLPQNIDWQGDASLDANVTWSPKRKPTGELLLAFTPGKVLLSRPKGQVVEVAYEELRLNASLTPEALSTRLRFLSGTLASLESEVSVKVTPDRTLDGFVRLDSIRLEALKEFLPQLDTLEGQLTSNLMLGGNLMEPQVSGDLMLIKGAFSASANPTLISDVDMDVNFAGQRAMVRGDWQMGDGPGELSGNIAWPGGEFSGELLVKGDKLAVIVPPMALLDVSPDLKLVFDAKTMDVKGAVNIPTGHIKIVQLAEGGVAVSNDVVFDDSIAAAEQKTSPYGIIADLNIRVGDEVKIEGMGLKGKLDGTIRLQQQAFKPPLLFGDVKVVSGSYKFMGQTLKIPKGEVQFVGPPQLPNLNIEAIREIKEEDLVAGVRITGTGMAPEVTLFSNPSKEQAEILSYIIKGKGFDSNGSGDNNALMMSAALSLSSSLSGGAINNIGSTATSLVEKFGFSNVQLDANDEGRVAISGYIGEDLMVKYGVGVFNPGYEMTVRYYLLSQLYLETVSGTLGQSLDIYYNFDL